LANHPSALKRAKQNKVRSLRNSSQRSRIKSGVKKFLQNLEAPTAREAAGPALKQVVSLIDKAGSKGVLHRRTASRKISRLSRKLNQISGQTPA
jgi:small subunit ribosomal protein S20